MFVRFQALIPRDCNVLLCASKSIRDLPEIRKDVLKTERSNGWDRIITRSRLRGMVKQKDCKALDRVGSFVPELIDRNMEHGRSATCAYDSNEILRCCSRWV